MVGLAALGDDLGPCILSRLVNEFEDFPRVSKNVFHDFALYLDELMRRGGGGGGGEACGLKRDVRIFMLIIRKKHAKNSYHMVCHHTLSKNGMISYQQIDISYQKIYISYPQVCHHTYKCHVISYRKGINSYLHMSLYTGVVLYQHMSFHTCDNLFHTHT
jgi:hypothetical protein